MFGRKKKEKAVQNTVNESNEQASSNQACAGRRNDTKGCSSRASSAKNCSAKNSTSSHNSTEKSCS